MQTDLILFIVFACLALLAGFFIAVTRSIICAAFSLFLALFAVAAIFVFARADFLAVTQIIVYVGGIMILLLFGIMLTNKLSSIELRTEIINVVPGMMVAAGMLFIILYSLNELDLERLHWMEEAKELTHARIPDSINQVGMQTMTAYLLPFEIISILLLVALIGAVYISRRKAPQARKIK